MAEQKPTLARSQAFRDPEDESDPSLSTTEELSEDGGIEDVIRQEVQDWLALHGSKLYTLEVSKYFAAEKKRSAPQKSCPKR